MRALIDFPPNVSRMVARILRRGPNLNLAPIPGSVRAQKLSPRMPIGHFYRPAERFRVLNREFNFLIGMPGSVHEHSSPLLTCVKQIRDEALSLPNALILF